MSAKNYGPKHYRRGNVQPWEAMQAWFSPEEFEGYLRGNVIKYIARCNDKHDTPLDDLYKAKHYLEMLIEVNEPDYGE